MKKILEGTVLLSLLVFLVITFLSCSVDQDSAKEETTIIRHIVLFKFKADAAKQDIDNAFSALLGLKEKIPGIISITAGNYESHEDLNKGFTFAFTIDFEDLSASERYHSHPERQKIKSNFINILDGGLDGVIAGELIPGDY